MGRAFLYRRLPPFPKKPSGKKPVKRRGSHSASDPGSNALLEVSRAENPGSPIHKNQTYSGLKPQKSHGPSLKSFLWALIIFRSLSSYLLCNLALHSLSSFINLSWVSGLSSITYTLTPLKKSSASPSVISITNYICCKLYIVWMQPFRGTIVQGLGKSKHKNLHCLTEQVTPFS